MNDESRSMKNYFHNTFAFSDMNTLRAICKEVSIKVQRANDDGFMVYKRRSVLIKELKDLGINYE